MKLVTVFRNYWAYFQSENIQYNVENYSLFSSNGLLWILKVKEIYVKFQRLKLQKERETNEMNNHKNILKRHKHMSRQ